MRTESSDGEIGAFVEATGRRARLRLGESVYLEGDRSRSVYVCIDGRIRLSVAAASGHRIVVQQCLPGMLFGELSALTGRPRASSAVAAADSVVAHLPGERFVAHLEDAPGTAVEVLRDLADQLHSCTRRLVARTSETAMSRTGHRLVELASRAVDEAGCVPRPSVVIDVRQIELADWVGTTRESVSRALAAYRAAGVLDTGRGHIAVHDLARLSELADSC